MTTFSRIVVFKFSHLTSTISHLTSHGSIPCFLRRGIHPVRSLPAIPSLTRQVCPKWWAALSVTLNSFQGLKTLSALVVLRLEVRGRLVRHKSFSFTKNSNSCNPCNSMIKRIWLMYCCAVGAGCAWEMPPLWSAWHLDLCVGRLVRHQISDGWCKMLDFWFVAEITFNNTSSFLPVRQAGVNRCSLFDIHFFIFLNTD